MVKQRFISAAILLGLLLVLGGGYAYWNFIDSPEYALKEARDALINKDLDTFKEYVNINQLSESIVDDLAGSQIAQKSEFAKLLLEKLKPQLALSLSKSLELYLQTGKFESDKGINLGGLGIDLFQMIPNADATISETLKKSSEGNIKSLTDKKEDGDVLVATLVLNSNNSEEDEKKRILLTFRKHNDHWQLVGIKNLMAYFKGSKTATQ